MLDGKGPALALTLQRPREFLIRCAERVLDSGSVTRSSHASPRHHQDRHDDTYVGIRFLGTMDEGCPEFKP